MMGKSLMMSLNDLLFRLNEIFYDKAYFVIIIIFVFSSLNVIYQKREKKDSKKHIALFSIPGILFI